ncbi:hypothetical protein ACJJI4_03020 [Microbulbifer sp. TRSA002]|uniref:hypothetical protein n=1 Tax=Microbulbifer sp. TRSA002 TaxID=3243382 RepID=UPI00403A5770
MDLLISMISSSTIAGLLMYIFRESFKAKLSRVKTQIERLEKYQDKDFDHSFNSINKIWVAFTRLDGYLRYDFPSDVESGKIDPRKLRPFFLEIKESMALLPDSLYETTTDCLGEISKQWEDCANKILNLMQRDSSSECDSNSLVILANKSMGDMRNKVDIQLQKLRSAYRKHVSSYQRT